MVVNSKEGAMVWFDRILMAAVVGVWEIPGIILCWMGFHQWGFHDSGHGSIFTGTYCKRPFCSHGIS